ncbi:MAG: DUF6694 family lipoprotein [Vibrio sp.]
MKKVFSTLCLLATAFLLTACGSPKLDGSSNEALDQSITTVMNELPAEKRDEFKKDLMSIYMAEAMSNPSQLASPEAFKATVAKKLDGKSADDIFKMGDDIKKDLDAKGAAMKATIMSGLQSIIPESK